MFRVLQAKRVTPMSRSSVQGTAPASLYSTCVMAHPTAWTDMTRTPDSALQVIRGTLLRSNGY